MTTIIADYPAYQIVAPEPRKEWKADETFAIAFESRRYGTLYHFFKLGSVVSYAMRYNECPIKAIERARERKHELHFAFALATVISSSPKPKETVVGLSWGDEIKFEGRTFKLVKAPNDNVRLQEVVTDLPAAK